ncbi:MAG: helix-turn-helix transcriptional regulator [Erysipelotrichales bacterium]|nr:helix-turn-helix transcriptional regulator [Erysipelotrichales bacterium]
MTFGEKLKEARKKAGMTQEQLANLLSVSRQAITKWESDKGMPDIENLKVLSKALEVSIDSLLDDGSVLDLTVTQKPIDLRKYGDTGKLSRIKKLKIKEQMVREEYPDAQIIRLTVTKIKNTKSEAAADTAIGLFALLLGNIPLFGTQEMGKTVKSLDHHYYLVNQNQKQFFVLLTDEFMICRTMSKIIQEKRFEIGDREFLVMGTVD